MAPKAHWHSKHGLDAFSDCRVLFLLLRRLEQVYGAHRRQGSIEIFGVASVDDRFSFEVVSRDARPITDFAICNEAVSTTWHDPEHDFEDTGITWMLTLSWTSVEKITTNETVRKRHHCGGQR